MDHLTKKEQADRGKINMHDPSEIKCWTREFRVSPEELQKAVEKGRQFGCRGLERTGTSRQRASITIRQERAALQGFLSASGLRSRSRRVPHNPIRKIGGVPLSQCPTPTNTAASATSKTA